MPMLTRIDDNDNNNHENWHFLNYHGMADDDNMGHINDDDLERDFDRKDVHNHVYANDEEAVPVPKEDPNFPGFHHQNSERRQGW